MGDNRVLQLTVMTSLRPHLLHSKTIGDLWVTDLVTDPVSFVNFEHIYLFLCGRTERGTQNRTMTFDG